MTIRVVRPAELSPADIAAWHSMQSGSDSLANPFLSAEFAIVAARFRPGIRVAVLSEGSSAVGFFPFERHGPGAGTPIAPGVTDAQALVHAPGARWDARELLRACGLSIWRFDHLVAGQAPFERYRTATSPSPFIDLTGGFDAYRQALARRSPEFCRNLERKARKLAREAGPLTFVADSRDEKAFRALLSWKSMQYRRTGQVDVFARPWVAGLVEALFSYRGDSFGGLLSVLYAGDVPVAAHFGLRGNGVLAHWFPAYDLALGKHSPGLIMHLRMAEFTPGAGIRVIDMGTGFQRYKEELKSGDFSVGAGIVTAGSAHAAAYRAGLLGSRRIVTMIRQNQAMFGAARWIRRRYRSVSNARADREP